MKKLFLLSISTVLGFAAHSHNIDFNSIQYWVGEGNNKAALVVQFNDEYGQQAYVYGYRWADGQTPTGEDMFKAICTKAPDLTILTQFTGIYGSTVCGIGYGDKNALLSSLAFDFNSAKDAITFDYYNPNTSMGQTGCPGDQAPALAQAAIDAAKTKGYIQHPFGSDTYGYAAYDYDYWQLTQKSESTRWKSGWYDGYWSYWTADEKSYDLGYSGVGYSSRKLRNGSVDGWSWTSTAEFGAGAAPDGDPNLLVYHEPAFKLYREENGVIKMTPRDMLWLQATMADGTETFDVTPSVDNLDVVTTYRVNYWDDNNKRLRPYEMFSHQAGTATLTVTDKEGNVRDLQVVVERPEYTRPENGYYDGTILLNEEWFGHTNGGLNYLTKDGEVIYNAYELENPWQSFGCTSQYGIVWADKLIVMSKQAADGGDPLPGGGRLVIADAKTFKRIGSLDDLKFGDETSSTDGRAVVGATPNKIYVSTNNGVYIVDITDAQPVITGKISAGEESTDLYNGQVGDMIKADKYVFGLKQSAGIFVIDTTTDKIVHEIADANIQGLARTADGKLWYTKVENKINTFVALNPATLAEVDRYTLPDSIGSIACSWGAWRTTSFTGSTTKNKLWFTPGSAAIAGGGAKVYSFDCDTREIKTLADISTLNVKGKVTQKLYGSVRYDDRTNHVIVSSCDNKASGNYRFNYIYLINGETGEVESNIAYRPYYWFHSMAIIPDKYAPEINLENVNLSMEDGAQSFDINDLIIDNDNPLSWMNYSISLAADEASASIAECSIADNVLTLTPKAEGKTMLNIEAESNGRTVTRAIPVSVTILSGVDGIAKSAESIVADNHSIVCRNIAGQELSVYDINGRLVARDFINGNNVAVQLNVENGIYVAKTNSGLTVKLIIK